VLDVSARTLDLGHHSRRPRVDTLIRLRWLAVSGQLAAVLATKFVLAFPIPFVLCILVVGASVWVNIGLRIRFHHNDRLADRAAFGLMAYDLLQLSLLLYLTGGLENPFAMLFLAPLMIVAVTLSARYTAALTLLVIVCASTLTFYHWPLPWFPGEPFELPFLYRVGIWGAIVLGASFAAAYAWRVAEEARRLSDALIATELVLAREQHLTQLDGLAAAAAHELGTPLATIKLVVRDLQKQFPKEGSVAEDLELLMQEVERCRKILGTLASLGSEPGDIIGTLSLSHLIEEVVSPQRDFGTHIVVVKEGDGPEPKCIRNPGVLYGLGNLVENAIDFAATEVRIVARWTDSIVVLVIEDDGPGFSYDVVMSLGEPYLTTKADRRAKSEDGSGLGLGLFIAKTLLERSGASITMANAVPPAKGARVTILWQRSEFEQGRTSRSLFGPDDTKLHADVLF
jgi:two-component system sensor histidine kinase RegB